MSVSTIATKPCILYTSKVSFQIDHVREYIHVIIAATCMRSALDDPTVNAANTVKFYKFNITGTRNMADLIVRPSSRIVQLSYISLKLMWQSTSL